MQQMQQGLLSAQVRSRCQSIYSALGSLHLCHSSAQITLLCSKDLYASFLIAIHMAHTLCDDASLSWDQNTQLALARPSSEPQPHTSSQCWQWNCSWHKCCGFVAGGHETIKGRHVNSCTCWGHELITSTVVDMPAFDLLESNPIHRPCTACQQHIRNRLHTFFYCAHDLLLAHVVQIAFTQLET